MNIRRAVFLGVLSAFLLQPNCGRADDLTVRMIIGPIWSGNGLNSLQECLGVSALQHETYLQNMLSIPETDRSPEQMQRLEILQTMAADVAIPCQLFSKIECCRIGENSRLL
jgi:hypothetical protein